MSSAEIAIYLLVIGFTISFLFSVYLLVFKKN
jgi:hypothetical protein